jgi:hypothetical protein
MSARILAGPARGRTLSAVGGGSGSKKTRGSREPALARRETNTWAHSELPWNARQELLDQLAHLDSMRSVRGAFEAVGTSQPVKLTTEQKGALLEVVQFWATQVRDGYEGLPEGIYELRCSLVDDLHDPADEA